MSKKKYSSKRIKETYQDINDFGFSIRSMDGGLIGFMSKESGNTFWTSLTIWRFMELDKEQRRGILRHAKKG